MKIIKKCLVGITAIGLTLSLSACGKKDSNEGDFGMSNVLNSKKLLPVVVTEGNNKEEKNHILWAGFIGQGKVKAMNLQSPTYFYGYKDLKKESDEEFNKSVMKMGRDTEPTPRKYITSKTNLKLTENLDSDKKGNKAKSQSLDFLNKSDDIKISSTRELINYPQYSKVVKKEDGDNWATIKTTDKAEEDDSDYKGYEMHVKLGEGNNYNFKIDDTDKAPKDYKNVEVN